MATFNKRGYKAPKEKEEKLDNTFIEDVNVDEKDSATAKAFDALDETASKTEDFVAKNQKYILGVLGGIALLTVGYLLYQKFVAEPNQVDAADELFVAQQNFQKAIDEIDKAIKRMEAVKAALTTSENQLRLANNKLDDVSVKKLTRNNPTMKAKFEALKGE